MILINKIMKALIFPITLLVSLFFDKRADESEMPDVIFRTGWIGDLNNDDESFQIGSKLWLLKKSRINQGKINKTITFALKLMDKLFKRRSKSHCVYSSIDHLLSTDGALIKFEGFIESGVLEYIFNYDDKIMDTIIRSKREIYDAVLRINKKVCDETISGKPLLKWDLGKVSLTDHYLATRGKYVLNISKQ